MSALVAAADTQSSSQVIRLWPGNEVSHEIAVPEGRFRHIDVPTLTAFLPGKDASVEFKGTAVIVCPGGRYRPSPDVPNTITLKI